MFQTWLNENDLSAIPFSARLFPRASEREYWESVLSRDWIVAAERYLGYEWPLMRASQFMAFHVTGSRKAQENPHFARRNALLSLFLGELAEHEGRFLPDLCDGIFLICEETYWGVSAHSGPRRGREMIPCVSDPYVDLFAAQTAENLMVIYDLLHDEIAAYCPQLPARIEYEMERRIVSPYLSREDFWWMGKSGKKVNNWNPWILSNLLTVFLTLPLPRETFERGVAKMMEEISIYYRTLPEDGGCDEGPGYWVAAGAKVFDFCNLLFVSSEGKVDLFRDEKLKRMGLFMAASHVCGQRFVNFADGLPKMGGNLDYLLYGFGKAVNAPALCQLAAVLKRERKNSAVPGNTAAHELLFSLLCGNQIGAPSEPEQSTRYVLPDLQTSYLREGDWYYAAKGGHNDESHNHNDVGSFLVYHKDLPILIDPGCGTYTALTFSPHRYTIWTMQSGWHNLPVLNGVEQSAGEKYRADAFSSEGDETTVSFAGAYPAAAGVERAMRRLEISSEGILLQDRFEFSAEENRVRENFITLLPPKPVDGGILLGDAYRLVTDLPCTVERMDFGEDPKLVGAWGQDRVYRISLEATCGRTAEIRVELRSVTE